MAEYIPIILLAAFGFFALAFILLAPVYRFLKREEKAGEEWTRSLRRGEASTGLPSTNGTTPSDDEPHPPVARP